MGNNIYNAFQNCFSLYLIIFLMCNLIINILIYLNIPTISRVIFFVKIYMMNYIFLLNSQDKPDFGLDMSLHPVWSKIG